MFWNKKTDINLKWGWTNETTEDYSLVIELYSVKKEKSGDLHKPKVGDVPFGLSCLGTIVGHENLNGKKVKIVIPDDEIDDLEIGNMIKLGVINDDTCISVVRV